MKRFPWKAHGLQRVGLRLSGAAVVLLLIGCEPKSEPASAVAAPDVPKPLVAVEKPIAKPSDPDLFDEFGLPLVIEIDEPEVPPEIQNPSPPIEDSHGVSLRRSLLPFLSPDSSPPMREERNPP